MSTRSITILMDGDTEIAVLYRHCDGYPTGQGADLLRILAGKKCVNGISGKGPQINGAGDMAAQVVAGLKGDSGGNFYLYPPGTRDVWEEYTYTVTYVGPGEAIRLVVDGHRGRLYDGPIGDFDPEKAEEVEHDD